MTDQQLEEFLLKLKQDYSGESKGDAAIKAALAAQRAEYEKKMRLLELRIAIKTSECDKLSERNHELEEDARQMVEQMKVRLEQAEIDIEKRCRKEFKRLLAEKEKEWTARIDELRRKLGELQMMYDEEVIKVEELTAQVQDLEAQIEALHKERARLQARIKELEPFVAKCDQLQTEADLWRKRYEQLLKEMEREDDPPKMEDSNSFEWAIPAMSAKLKFPKGRNVQSPEFQIAGLKEPVQIEFFPRGDSSTWDGWCGIKLRVPDETQLLWSAWVGTQRQGPRLDLFDQNTWWCRNGLLWSNFCLIHDLMTQIDDADNLICGIEVHAIGPFAREDPEHPLGPGDPEHIATDPTRPGRPRTAKREARTDPAVNQWKSFGFLEVEEDSPKLIPIGQRSPSRGNSRGNSRGDSRGGMLPDAPKIGWSSPKKGSPQKSLMSSGGFLESLDARKEAGMQRSIHSRSESRLATTAPWGQQRHSQSSLLPHEKPSSPAYNKWLNRTNPGMGARQR